MKQDSVSSADQGGGASRAEVTSFGLEPLADVTGAALAISRPSRREALAKSSETISNYGWGGDAMNKITISFYPAVLLCTSYAYAQQPTFPFLQEGGARNSFVRDAIISCLKTHPANQSQDRIEKFCNCYARKLADVINGQEYEAMVAGEVLESLRDKLMSSAPCTTLDELPVPYASARSRLVHHVGGSRCRGRLE
jgi:hypothetical protein